MVISVHTAVAADVRTGRVGGERWRASELTLTGDRRRH